MISPKISHCIHPFFRNYAPVSTPSYYFIGYSVIKDTVSRTAQSTLCAVVICSKIIMMMEIAHLWLICSKLCISPTVVSNCVCRNITQCFTSMQTWLMVKPPSEIILVGQDDIWQSGGHLLSPLWDWVSSWGNLTTNQCVQKLLKMDVEDDAGARWHYVSHLLGRGPVSSTHKLWGSTTCLAQTSASANLAGSTP